MRRSSGKRFLKWCVCLFQVKTLILWSPCVGWRRAYHLHKHKIFLMFWIPQTREARRAAPPAASKKKIIKTPHPHPGSIPWPRAWKSDALPTTPLGLDGDDRGQYAIVQDCNGTPCGCRRIDLDLANSVAFFFSLTTYGLVLAKARHFAHFITSNFHDLWNTLDISTPGIKTWWPQQSLFEIW